MRKIVSLTSHPDFVAVEKLYIAFLTLQHRNLIDWVKSQGFSGEETAAIFLEIAAETCDELSKFSLEDIDCFVESINPTSQPEHENICN